MNRLIGLKRQLMKGAVAALMLLGTAGPAAAQSETVTVGTGTSTTWQDGDPFYGYYNYTTTASLYTSTEIGQSGCITAIAYNCASASAFSGEVHVYMATVNKTTFSGGNDWPTSYTEVYSNASATFASSTGWNTITLSTPYYYDQSAGSLVVIVTKNASWKNQTWYYSSSASTHLYRGNDDYTNYADVTNTSNGSLSNNRPNIQFTFKKFYFSATANATAGGTASALPATTDVVGTTSCSSATTTATFTATPNSGYRFNGWSETESGAIVSTDNPYAATITSTSTSSGSPTNTTLYARFQANVSPTAIAANQASVTTYVGTPVAVGYTLTPADAYDHVAAASANTGVFTTDAWGSSGSVAVTPVAAGQSTLTLTPYKLDNSTLTPVTVTVTVRDKVATPAIAFTPDGSDITKATVTLTCATPGTTIYYTLDGSNPTASSTEYTAPFQVDENVEVRAIAIKTTDGTYWDNSDVATGTYVSCNTAAPVVTYVDNGSLQATVTINAEAGASVYYTTDGTDPTTGSTSYSGSFAVAGGTTVKAIAKNGICQQSSVASKEVIATGVTANGEVILNDYEDHAWSYYSDPECPIRSLNPADVKITYLGNGKMYKSTTATPSGDLSDATGVKVGIDADDSTFVYYKTLERSDGDTATSVSAAKGRCAYTTIPNPFSVRPTFTVSSIKYYTGFYTWRVKSYKGGRIYNAASGGDSIRVGGTINAETEVYFAPTASTGMEVELEAVWARAYVVTTNTTSGMNTEVSYERNFMVLTSGSNINPSQSTSYAYTLTSVYPNGTSDGDNATTVKGSTTIRGASSGGGGGGGATYSVALSSNTKFEYVGFNNCNTITAAGHDLIIGRGCTSTNVGTVRGMSDGSSSAVNYTIRLESGTYGTFALIDNTARTFSSTVSTRAIFGSDYDRAKSDNGKLSIAANSTVYGGNAAHTFSSSSNRNNITYDWLIKSGKVQGSTAVGDANANVSIYIGNSISSSNANSIQYCGKRRLIMEGGEIASIAGSVNCYGNNYANYGVNDGTWSVMIRLKGGTVRGSIYGAAAYAGASGDRRFVLTGGTVQGWVAGGANGTQSDGGMMYGASAIYIGGKTQIDSRVNGTSSTAVINRAVGGNVFGAGCGYGTSSNSGQVTLGTTVVVADNAYIERGVYGGGSYGYTTATADIYILGGTVDGKAGGVSGTSYSANITGGVYGGACQNQGGTVNITMKGGEVHTGLYGGSNATGTISGNVTMHINGGQVGTTTQSANIHGGGYGSATAVSGNVDLTLGKTNATSGVTVYGDVYGGSADGSVNDATSDHTYVTLNAGTIYGSLYGGGLGITNADCNVNGPVQVVVNGGSVKKQSSGSNPASVFGCNNAMGSPKSTVTVTVNKTDTTVVDGSGNKAYAINGVYGGGNLAHYNPTTPGDYPTVTVNGCTSSIKDVYGGGNAAAVPYTNVTINGGDIDRVFAGGNGESSTPAHVGYRNTDANPSTDNYGSGNTNATINGGSINQVFGGSNANGVIRGSINVSAQKSGSCDLKVKALYGGGNQAPSNAGNISIGCMTAADMIDTVYGGSNDADISGDISLTMTGGRIGNLFGGNNTGHSIDGDISVEVNWSGSCSNNYLGNVFGGGNMAAYSGGPSVSVLNGTVSGSVYGGGKGSTAVVTGNPTVAIGDNTAAHCAIVEGNVYGGGDAAAVSGKSHVTYNDNNAASRVANLFGGGNAASVSDSATVDMTLGQVTDGIYGGCNSSGSVGAATVNLTGGQVGTSESRADIFGGGFGAATTTTAGIDVNVGATTIHGDIYGGSALGSVNASTTDITTVDITGSAVHGKVYGGGKGQADATDTVCATSHGQAIVNIKTANADLDGIYGGANINGLVEGDIEVNVTANTACAVFGGGFGALTATDGDVTVNIGTATGYASAPTINGNVYGGSALGSVNGSTADTTTVNILNGHITGHVFGGGLGHKTYNPDNKDANGVVVYDADSTAAIEKGNVVVNIGSAAQTTYNDTYKGYNNVTVDGMVFGGNDSCGTPLGDVYVNIYHTAHTAADQAHDQSDVDNPGIGAVADLPGEGEGDYALSAVYGGGNLAHYAAAGKKATVHIYGCENTIEYAYGGGNAADVPACELTVEGGDYFQIFGGGNGAVSYLPGANVTEGDATTNVYGGIFTSIFGGSNTKGNIAGEMKLTIDQSKGSCGLEIVGNLYGGGNKAPSKGGNLTVECGEIVLGNVYGGANAAYVDGDVTLTMKGGKDIGYVFGGSRSVATENHINGYAISGDVTLRLYGGTITNAFGGSDSIGNIKGNIKVLLIDSAIANCPLKVDNVYGGGKDAAYAPADGTAATPAVNVLHGTVNNAVFGGGLGAGATVTANPTVTIGDADKAANHAIVGATKIAGGTGDGNVFGGGSQADVLKSGDGVGNTTVTLTGQADVMGNVYGGGNEADVEGNSKVEMK